MRSDIRNRGICVVRTWGWDEALPIAYGNTDPLCSSRPKQSLQPVFGVGDISSSSGFGMGQTLSFTALPFKPFEPHFFGQPTICRPIGTRSPSLSFGSLGLAHAGSIGPVFEKLSAQFSSVEFCKVKVDSCGGIAFVQSGVVALTLECSSSHSLPSNLGIKYDNLPVLHLHSWRHIPLFST